MGSTVNLKKKFTTTLRKHHRRKMEDDRAQVDLGVAVDVEERLEEAIVQRQPKRRFVGRRTAEAASSCGTFGNQEHNGAIEGRLMSVLALSMYVLMFRSIKTKTDA